MGRAADLTTAPQQALEKPVDRSNFHVCLKTCILGLHIQVPKPERSQQIHKGTAVESPGRSLKVEHHLRNSKVAPSILPPSQNKVQIGLN